MSHSLLLKLNDDQIGEFDSQELRTLSVAG